MTSSKIRQSVLLTLLLFICFSVTAQKKPYLIVGTYTETDQSSGVFVYSFDTKTGNIKAVDSAVSSNPSFVAVAPNKKTIYVVNENADSTLRDGGAVSSFAFNKANGSLKQTSTQPSGGAHPCYVTVSNNGKWLFAANYSSGTFSEFPLNADATIGVAVNNIRHFGKGANKDRQEGPHVHGTFLTSDNKLLLVPDLGTDKIMLYDFNAGTGKLTEAKNPYIAFPGGSGPRHIAFHPSQKYLYVIQELTGSVAAFRFNASARKADLFQTISTVPDNFKGDIGSADIHVSPDGKFLYGSNRGESNTIAIYSINQATGILTLKGFQSVLGIAPRNFNFDPTGNFLLVANQRSNEIVVFKVNHQTGLLTDTGKRMKVHAPVCIKWIAQ